ncbi:hypothetical protein GF312_20610 [Candidatus Poribacteria bacterium]|nr:hypothetical protein [Candidatus Poribacteria bacterium]
MKRLTRDKRVPLQRRYQVLKPVMKVEPGETIVVETVNHMTPIVRSESDVHPHGSPEYQEREETGPIYVEGAKSGDALAIHIENIDIVGLPHAYGCGPLVDEYPQKPRVFPVENDRCILPGGVSVPIHPMVGDIYTTPNISPRFYDHGGNMDFTEIKPGNTLYLPVYHDGGLLVLGDVHAVQGDGEIYGEGAETAADITIIVEIDRKYRNPRPLVETDDSLITLACREKLFDSIQLATRDMTELLSKIYDISKEDAYITCNLSGSLRIAGSMSRRYMTEERCIVGLSVEKDIEIIER